MKILFILLCIISLSYAGKERFSSPNWQLSIGTSLYWFSYSEQFTNELFNTIYPSGIPPMNGEPKSDEYGLTNGVSISFINEIPLFISIQGFFSYSKIHTYDGALQDTSQNGDTLIYPPFEMDDKQNRFNGLSLKLGYAIPLSDKISLTPYTGIALNRWNRALGISTGYNTSNELDTFSTFDISEVYHWTQVPVGLKLTVQRSQQRTFTLDGSVDFMIQGSMEYLRNRDVFATFDSATEVILGNHPGFSVTLGLGKRYSKLIALTISPYYRYHHFGLSNRGEQLFNGGTMSIYFYEPESITHSFGLDISCIFHLSEKKR